MYRPLVFFVYRCGVERGICPISLPQGFPFFIDFVLLSSASDRNSRLQQRTNKRSYKHVLSHQIPVLIVKILFAFFPRIFSLNPPSLSRMMDGAISPPSSSLSSPNQPPLYPKMILGISVAGQYRDGTISSFSLRLGWTGISCTGTLTCLASVGYRFWDQEKWVSIYLSRIVC